MQIVYASEKPLFHHLVLVQVTHIPRCRTDVEAVAVGILDRHLIYGQRQIHGAGQVIIVIPLLRRDVEKSLLTIQLTHTFGNRFLRNIQLFYGCASGIDPSLLASLNNRKRQFPNYLGVMLKN